MCLVTKQKRPKTAKEEIRVYKFLLLNYETIFNSPYNSQKWIPGKLEETKIKKTNNEEEMGFFDERARNYYKETSQFSVDDELLYLMLLYWMEGLIFYTEGFHFALSPERLKGMGISKETIYEFTIPKGAKYYLDETGLGVTNKIIMAPLN